MKQSTTWFRAKRYGYGWYPITWQGWAIIAMYLYALVEQTLRLEQEPGSIAVRLVSWFSHVIIITVFLMIICEAYGEPGRWRWGGVDKTGCAQ